MDIPFIKKNNTSAWVAAGVAGTIVAGAVAFMYFTKRGFAFWNWNSGEGQDEHAEDQIQPYMQPHGLKRKQKTDLKDLESIIHHEG
ncbi:MAG TPA: hypothetical protein VNW95_10105 [Mucilaginibacter sp.]|nr:hypothetical protein [Mucilaginibacter sp.]